MNNNITQSELIRFIGFLDFLLESEKVAMEQLAYEKDSAGVAGVLENIKALVNVKSVLVRNL